MQSSRFSTLLIAALSASLGAALTASPAVGYPAGAAVSYGANPIRSGTGVIDLAGSISSPVVLGSTDTQQLIITDLLFGFIQEQNHCRGAGEAKVIGSDGVTYARIPVYSTTLGNATSQASQISTRSGFAVPENTSIHVEWAWSWRECDVSQYGMAYNLTGYLSTP